MSGSNGLDDRIKRLFEGLFRVSPELVDDDTRRGALEGWDSLGHLNLVDALREEFGVEISPEQALDIETVRDIKGMIQALREA